MAKLAVSLDMARANADTLRAAAPAPRAALARANMAVCCRVCWCLGAQPSILRLRHKGAQRHGGAKGGLK